MVRGCPRGRARTDADPFHRDARASESLGHPSHHVVRPAGCIEHGTPVGQVVDLTLVREDPDEPQAWELVRHRPGEGERVLRRDAAPVVAVVDLHQGVEGDAIRSRGLAQRPRPFERLHERRDPDPMSEVDQPAHLALPDDRVRDRDVTQTGGRHHLGLAELLTGDPHRSGLHLQQRELGGLVALDVGPEREVAISTEPRHRLDVRCHPVEVDDEAGRVDVVDECPRVHHGAPRSLGGHGDTLTPQPEVRAARFSS